MGFKSLIIAQNVCHFFQFAENHISLRTSFKKYKNKLIDRKEKVYQSQGVFYYGFYFCVNNLTSLKQIPEEKIQ